MHMSINETRQNHSTVQFDPVGFLRQLGGSSHASDSIPMDPNRQSLPRRL